MMIGNVFVRLIAAGIAAVSLGQAQQTVAAKDRAVIVISLDGFPAYALEDPKLPIPNLRTLMQQGSWAKRMHAINPTVTWPNHTTMVTGVLPPVHGLLYNGTMVRSGENNASFKVDWSIEKEKMVHTPTLYDVAHKAGLTTSQVDWVAINNAPTITWAFPEKAATSDALVQEMMQKNVISAEDVGNSGKPTVLWRDQIWTRAGKYIIEEHKPNLLLFHLLDLDGTHHAYGPKTLAGYDAIAFLDSCVGELMRAVEKAGLIDRATFIIVSDHGFKAVHQDIELNSILHKANLDTKAHAVSEGGSAMIYCTDPDKAKTVAAIREAFGKVDGISKIAGPEDFGSLGLPDPAKDPQMADVVLYAKTDFGFSGSPKTDLPAVQKKTQQTGSHGYASTDPDMDAIFIASGYGIKKGVVLDEIRNLSVAPTLAKLLGVRLPVAKEPALDSILLDATVAASN